MWSADVSLRYVLVTGGASIVITEQAIRTMNRYRQTASFQKEAGGQLFGLFDRARTIVVEATPPKWLDRRGPRKISSKQLAATSRDSRSLCERAPLYR